MNLYTLTFVSALQLSFGTFGATGEIVPTCSGTLASTTSLLSSAAHLSSDGGLLWLTVGLAAQAIIAGCIVAQWAISRRRKKLVIPPMVCYFCALATLLLLVYAAVRHDIVFVVGQLLNTFICMRLVALIHIRRAAKQQVDKRLADGGSGFPVVSPDSAELRLPPKNPPSSPGLRRGSSDNR